MSSLNQTKTQFLSEIEAEIARKLWRLARLECAKCAATPEGATPEPCSECLTGALRGRITELEAEFHQDFLMNRWVGRCGHRWSPPTRETPERCPICELIAKGRPKGLVKRVAEMAFYG